MIKKNALYAALIGMFLGLPTTAMADDLADQYFSNSELTLTPQEQKALDIARDFKAGIRNGSTPISGPNGSVQLVYGAQEASVVCAVLEICDVALQPGERVTPSGIHLGDTVRWTVDPALSGTGANEQQHLIIKPMDVGLETSLMVATDRRTYHLKLRSTRNDYMPSISFLYPNEALAKWETIAKRQAQEKAQDRHDNTMPDTREYLGNLNFDYELSGSAPWKPIRVYNDGKKTIIQMPESMGQTEAPTLLIVTRNSGIFTDEKTARVNYRLQNSRYIVDRIFDRAVLVAGVGDDQDRITITRRQ